MDMGTMPLPPGAPGQGDDADGEYLRASFQHIKHLTEAEHQKLVTMVRELSGALTSVKHEQEIMTVRERVHRSSASIRVVERN